MEKILKRTSLLLLMVTFLMLCTGRLTYAKTSEDVDYDIFRYTVGVGEKITYNLPEANARSASPVKYYVNHPDILEINKNGKIKTLSEGSGTITVWQNHERVAKVKIKVKKAPTQMRLYSDSSSMTLYKNWSRKITPQFGTGEVCSKITYKSSDSKVVSVSKKGVVKAKKKGTATITVKTYNGLKKKIKITVKNKPSSKSSGYPKVITDKNTVITITRTWYENAYVYAAHIEFNNFKRFGTLCANNKYNNGTSTVKRALSRNNALFGTNGCYSAPYLDYTVARGGKVCNNGPVWSPGVYNSNTGIFSSPKTAGCEGMDLKTAVKKKLVTDTFCFGPAFLEEGNVVKCSDTSRAQRTFIGSNGNPGDIWLCVSEGRGVESSSGLTYNQCAKFLKSKGCKHGIPLDGGGSSGMYTKNNGMINKTGQAGRDYLVDFVMYK